MKKICVAIVITVSLAAGLVLAQYFPRLEPHAQPGDVSDPLVTQRYVDERIAEIMSLMFAMLEDVPQNQP